MLSAGAWTLVAYHLLIGPTLLLANSTVWAVEVLRYVHKTLCCGLQRSISLFSAYELRAVQKTLVWIGYLRVRSAIQTRDQSCLEKVAVYCLTIHISSLRLTRQSLHAAYVYTIDVEVHICQAGVDVLEWCSSNALLVVDLFYPTQVQ